MFHCYWQESTAETLDEHVAEPIQPNEIEV